MSVAQAVRGRTETATMSSEEMRGRPPKPPDERASARLNIRITNDDKKAFQQAAAAAGKPLAAWLRDELKRVADAHRKRRK